MTVLAYVVCALVWSTTWYAIRLCIGPGGYPVFLSAALRFTIAAALLGAAVLAGAGRPLATRRQAGWIAVAGLINTAGYALVYLAEKEISGGLAAVIYGTMPLVTGGLAAVTGTERLQARTVAGALVGLLGVGLIFHDRLAVSPGQAQSVLLVLLSVVCASAYSVVLKRHVSAVNPIASTAAFFPVTAAGLWALALSLERQPLPWPPPPAPTGALLYLAVFGSVLTFAAYFHLVAHVRLSVVTTLVLVEPVLALAVDALLERRVQLSPVTYLGAALTAAGVVVGLLGGGAPAPGPAPGLTSHPDRSQMES
jgi:drug/metabolite transporter (DMT)-like permease